METFYAIRNLSKEMAELTFQIGQPITKKNLLPIIPQNILCTFCLTSLLEYNFYYAITFIGSNQ
jgi:uncharacterized membrane protein YdjX (TVP38/TMEM64 family)